MKRLLSIAALAAVIAFAVISFSNPIRVHANHGWEIVSVTCSSGTISMLIFEDASTGTSVNPHIAINGVYLKTLPDLDGPNVNDGNHTYTDSDAAYRVGATVTVSNSNGIAVNGPSSASASCGSNAITWFNPNDGRLNGQPGDRIVVYCNTKQTPLSVDVWVVDNNSIGHELTKLPLSDLTSVAEGKFSKNLGASGVLFAGSDASGNGYAALQGGPYGGTAKGDWLKTFSCKAS